MRNMNDVITELTKVFDGLKDGSIPPEVATELNNTCGKIINASKVQLMYAALRQEKPSIQFLDAPQPITIENGSDKGAGAPLQMK